MPNGKFDWSQVPTGSDGFVDYSLIKSHQVRLMIMDAEKIKLTEELTARQKWSKTESNRNRIKVIEERMEHLQKMV